MSNTPQFQSCIEACLRCASMCNFCASSCIKEVNIKMAHCIQLNTECAVLCYTTAQLLSLGSGMASPICIICADICEACGEECSRHDNEHCKHCAELCIKCADECRKMKNR